MKQTTLEIDRVYSIATERHTDLSTRPTLFKTIYINALSLIRPDLSLLTMNFFHLLP